MPLAGVVNATIGGVNATSGVVNATTGGVNVMRMWVSIAPSEWILGFVVAHVGSE